MITPWTSHLPSENGDFDLQGSEEDEEDDKFNNVADVSYHQQMTAVSVQDYFDV